MVVPQRDNRPPIYTSAVAHTPPPGENDFTFYFTTNVCYADRRPVHDLDGTCFVPVRDVPYRPSPGLFIRLTWSRNMPLRVFMLLSECHCTAVDCGAGHYLILQT